MRILHGIGDGLVAGEIAEIGERRMAGVEQPQLHQLERLDVGDELDARGGEIGPARGKAILDHPLRERLGHHRPGVTHPECRGDRIAVGIRRFRHDAIDHGAGEGNVIRDPLAEVLRAKCRELRHDPLHGVAVGGEVVAAQHGEGRKSLRPSPRQRSHDEAGRRARRVKIVEIVHDIGMPLVEIAGLRRVAIALLGDRERDDANGGIGHPLDQCCRLFARDDAVEQRADDAMLGAFGGAHGDRVEMILRGEGVARLRTAQARADDAPGYSMRRLRQGNRR